MSLSLAALQTIFVGTIPILSPARQILVGTIPIYQHYRPMSSYSHHHCPSPNYDNTVQPSQTAAVESKHSSNRRTNSHFQNKRKRSDPRPVHRTRDNSLHQPDEPKGLQKSQLFDICLRTTQISGIAQDIPDANNSTEDQILGSGMVLLKRHLSLTQQINIVKTCRDLGLGPAGFFQPQYHSGAKLSLRMMCMGLHWNHLTRKYDEQRPEGTRPPTIPEEFSLLVKEAVNDARALIKTEVGESSSVENILPGISPDICIANFYTTTGRLGLHQDRDESTESLRKGLPVVSISIGDSAEFFYGNERDIDKASKVILESGDILIFGGESRHVFHGVKSIIENSAPRSLLEEVGLRPGRLNLTFRQF
ncbi:hypothetical protein ACFE04_003665 [Oxalis oulophora]